MATATTGWGDGGRLSLRDVEAHPRQVAPRGDGWRSYRCPLPACADGTRPALRVNMATGGYQCHRCGATGILEEWRDRRDAGGRPADRLAPARRRLHRALAVPAPVAPATAPPAPATWPWQAQWDAAAPLDADDPIALDALAYVWSRGIPPDIAIRAGWRACAAWGTPERDDGGRWRRPGPAIVVPLVGPDGAMTGAQGRYTDGREREGWRKVQTGGSGVAVTPGALDADPVAIVEGPLDALAMQAGGPGWAPTPAIAVVRTALPPWLATRCLGRTVTVALDADDAGDRGADVALDALRRWGAQATRARPTGGAKDWADARAGWWREAMAGATWPPPHDPGRPALDDVPVPRDPAPLPPGWWPGRA